MAIDTNGRSVSSVLCDIVQNVQDIVRAEVRLAKTELAQEVVKAKTAGIFLGIAAVCGFFSAFFILFAAVFALSIVIPNWAAAAVVAAATGIGAGVLTYAGRKWLNQVNPISEHTTENLKETFRWTKQHIKSKHILKRPGTSWARIFTSSYKVKQMGDWHHHFSNHPFTLLGAAFGGGILLATMLGTSRSARVRTMSADTSPHKQKAIDTWDHIKDALIGVAATRVTDFVGHLVPGFKEEFANKSKSESANLATEFRA